MSGVAEWFRKFGHRLCKTQVPDKFLVPQLAGNIETAELRHFKKMVQKGRLAPFYPGHDEPSHEVVECPICFTYYRVMNKTKCCGQRLCSECIVKIRMACPLSGIACPFCKKSGLDVEICEGKSESEKQEELLDEQRFVEYRLRQLEEAGGNRRVSTTREEQNDADGAILHGPPAADVGAGEQTNAMVGQEGSGNASDTPRMPQNSNDGTIQTPNHIQDDYRQQYVAISSPATVPSNLSTSELRRCEDYLGVCPEDLGLCLDEFNDLLLEQTLISSMIEMKRAENRQEEEARRRDAEGTSDDQGGSSSNAAVQPPPPPPLQNPSPRSHSLPLAHPLADVEHHGPEAERDSGNGSPPDGTRLRPDMQSSERCWSLENVFRQVSNSSPFSFFATLRGGESLQEAEANGATPPPPSPFSLQRLREPADDEPVAEREGDEGATTEASSPTDDSSVDVGESLKNLLNSMAGFNNVHTQFRMMMVRFDDPQIDAAFNGRPSSTRNLDGADSIEMTERRRDKEEEVPAVETGPEAIQTTKPMAVENPDGSVALISVPCNEAHEAQDEQRTNEHDSGEVTGGSTTTTTTEDRAVVRAMTEADRSQVNAIEGADARLRQLYNRHRL